MPRFSDRTIEEIKNKIRLSDLVGEYTKLERRGGTYWARCPFHANGMEKTPSFKIDDQKGLYYCFGCHESGTIFTFIQKMEHLDFPSSVEYLASKAGVAIRESTAEDAKRKDESALLYDLHDRLAKTFHYILLNDERGRDALSYIKRRGIDDEMISTFLLGYAPKDSNFLYDFLRKKGYSDDILRKSGLFSQNKFPYPLFRDRIIFPVRNYRGQVIAFSGRDLSNSDGAPKYINTPDTLIYSKRMNLFGLYESLEELKKKDSTALICEGNFDVISMHQAGFKSAMASLGTAFTDDQAKLIARYTDTVDLMFDSDEAGQKSTDKVIGILNGMSFKIRIHNLRSYKDASESLEKLGRDGLKEEYLPYRSAYEYLVEKNLKSYNIRTPRGKSDFLKSLSAFLSSTKSEIELESYIQDLALRLGVGEDTVKADLRNLDNPYAKHRYEEKVEETDRSDLHLNIAAISPDLYAMLILANNKNLFKQYRLRINFGDLKDRDAQVLYTVLENALRDDIESKELFLSLISDERLRNYVSTSYELDEFKTDCIDVLDEIVDRIELRGLEEKRASLNSQIKLLSSQIEPEDMMTLLEKKKDYDKEISLLKNRLYSSEEK